MKQPILAALSAASSISQFGGTALTHIVKRIGLCEVRYLGDGGFSLSFCFVRMFLEGWGVPAASGVAARDLIPRPRDDVLITIGGSRS